MLYNMVDVGNRIKQLIRDKGLKKSNICILDAKGNPNEAKHLNFSRPTLNKILEGKAELSFNDMLEICNFFDVSIDYLLGESDYTNREAEAAGKYLEFSPATVDYLHKTASINKPINLNRTIDYLFTYNPQHITDIIDLLASAISGTIYKRLIDDIENSMENQTIYDVDRKELVDTIIDLAELSEGYDIKAELMESVHRLEIQDKIKELIDSISPYMFVAYFDNKAYGDAMISQNPKDAEFHKRNYERVIRLYERKTGSTKKKK